VYIYTYTTESTALVLMKTLDPTTSGVIDTQFDREFGTSLSLSDTGEHFLMSSLVRAIGQI
jgi:hypothetical protein